MNNSKTKLLVALLTVGVITGVNATVSDIQASSGAKRLGQAKDSYTPSASNPGYQSDSLGSTWTPVISLNNSSGTPDSINLNNGTGTPIINLARSYGSIAGTSGTNSSINSKIASSTTNETYKWYRSESVACSYAPGPKVTIRSACSTKHAAGYYYSNSSETNTCGTDNHPKALYRMAFCL